MDDAYSSRIGAGRNSRGLPAACRSLLIPPRGARESPRCGAGL